MHENKETKRTKQMSLFSLKSNFSSIRSISIMREARTKLRMIKPEDMDMEEYMVQFIFTFIHLFYYLSHFGPAAVYTGN